jgi:hypothetical protein
MAAGGGGWAAALVQIL